MVGDILRDHGAGSDEGVFTDGVAADDGAVCPKGSAFLDKDRSDLVHLGDFSTRIVDIGKDHGRTAEDAIFEGHAFVDTDIVLDLALIADSDVGTDHAVLAEVAVLADLGTGENMGKVPDFRSFADGDVIVDDGRRVDEVVGKKGAVPHFSFLLLEGFLADLQDF